MCHEGVVSEVIDKKVKVKCEGLRLIAPKCLPVRESGEVVRSAWRMRDTTA